MLRSCFLSSIVEFSSAVSEKKLKMCQPIRGQGGHLFFRSAQKTHTLKMTLRSCFLSIFIAFRSAVLEEKSKMTSANQRPGRPSCCSNRPEKHKLGRRHWYLASCQVSLNSVLAVSEKSKMCQPIRGQGGHLVFLNRPKKHRLGRGRWDLASYQVSLNSFQRFQRRSRKCVSQSEARVAILFFRSARKTTNLVEDVEILLPVKIRWIPLRGFREEVENVKS